MPSVLLKSYGTDFLNTQGHQQHLAAMNLSVKYHLFRAFAIHGLAHRAFDSISRENISSLHAAKKTYSRNFPPEILRFLEFLRHQVLTVSVSAVNELFHDSIVLSRRLLPIVLK